MNNFLSKKELKELGLIEYGGGERIVIEDFLSLQPNVTFMQSPIII